MKWAKHRLASNSGPRQSVSLEISLCGDLTPPNIVTSSVRSSCTIRAQLDISQTPIIQGVDGKQYKLVEFEIEMTVIGTALEFALIFQGKRMNHSQIETEFES